MKGSLRSLLYFASHAKPAAKSEQLAASGWQPAINVDFSSNFDFWKRWGPKLRIDFFPSSQSFSDIEIFISLKHSNLSVIQFKIYSAWFLTRRKICFRRWNLAKLCWEDLVWKLHFCKYEVKVLKKGHIDDDKHSVESVEFAKYWNRCFAKKRIYSQK